MTTYLRSILAAISIVSGVIGTSTPILASSTPMNVRVNGNGDLLVTARQNDLDVQINANIAGSYAVWVTDETGQLHVYNPSGVTRDVKVNLKSHTGVHVEIGSAGPFSVPASLQLTSFSPVADLVSVVVHNATIGADYIQRGSFEVDIYDSEILDDLMLFGEGGNAYLQADNTAVSDYVIARALNVGSIELEFTNYSTAARLKATGGDLTDSVEILDSEITGPAIIKLGGGDDNLFLRDSHAAETFVYRGRNGNDRFKLAGVSWSPVDVLLQAGADSAILSGELPNGGADSRIHGGGGNDVLHLTPSNPEAAILSFEENY